jgi:hypothetical protein
MIFWNTNKLAEQLRNNELSQREILSYYIFDAVVIGFISYLPTDPNTLPDSFFFGIAFIMAVINLFGLLNLADINEKGDGKNIVERLVCLSVPVSLKLLSLWIAILILFIILKEVVSASEKSLEIVFELSSVFITIHFYILMNRALRITSKKYPPQKSFEIENTSSELQI